MRYLVLQSTDEAVFDVAQQGMHMTRRPLTGQETRVLSRIMDKFEAIATVVDGLDPSGKKITTFKMVEAGGLVPLEDAEYNLLVDILEQTPWLSGSAKRIAGALDLISQAPTTPPVLKAVDAST